MPTQYDLYRLDAAKQADVAAAVQLQVEAGSSRRPGRQMRGDERLEAQRDGTAPALAQRRPERDPVNTTPAEYRAMRGGSWMHDDPAFIRIAGRRGLIPVGHLGPDLGFGCAGTP